MLNEYRDPAHYTCLIERSPTANHDTLLLKGHCDMLIEESGFRPAAENYFDGHDHGSLCTIHPFQNSHLNNASLNKWNPPHDRKVNVNS